MAKTEIYYWVDLKSTFGGGESPIQCGDPMPAGFEKDERFESFKKSGLISTEKVASKRVFSELEELKAKVIELEKSKGSGSKITQEQLDTAQGESVQADLDRIAELEGSEAQGTLELIKESLAKIQQGDSKAEIWDAVKSVKDLFEGE